MALLRQLVGMATLLPAEVDANLADLGTADAWASLSAQPQDFDAPSAQPRAGEIDFVVQHVIYMAVIQDQPRSKQLLNTWLSDPAAYCYRAERTCVHLRDYLASGGPQEADIRERAFTLFALPIGPAAQHWRTGNAQPEGSVGRTVAERAVKVAVGISRELWLIVDFTERSWCV